MDQIAQFFRNLGTAKLIMVAVVGLATFTFFTFIVGRLQTAPMEVLFSNLEPADSAEIVQRLEAQGVQVVISGGGTAISVPSDQVDRLRLSLAGEGLTGGVIGKEIFDQEGSFGRTSFELNVNFVRAIEGELSRTITSLSAVSEARVHVVMPERRPFQRELSQPSASILLRVRGGGLGGEQVRAVQALVASAVPGLSTDRVTVSDTNGRLLSDGNIAGTAGALASLEEARLTMEERFRLKIEGLISSSVGPGNVRANVALELDNSRKTEKQELFDPDGQVTRATDTNESQRQDVEDGGRVTVGDTQPDSDPADTGSGGSSSETATREVVEFDNSKTETVTVTEPGQIRLMRVAVMINESAIPGLAEAADANARAQLLQPFEDLVRSAVPYDADRDGADAIQVVGLQFVDPPEVEELEPEFNLLGLNKNDVMELVQLIGLVISGILFLVLVVRPIVARVVEAIPDAPPPPDPNAQLENANADLPAITGPDGSVTVTPEVIARAADGDEQAAKIVAAAKASGGLSVENATAETRIDVAQIEGQVQDSAIKRVSEIIKSNPDDSVAIVRTWMYAE